MESLTLPINLSNGNQGRQKAWQQAARVKKEYETIVFATGKGRRKPFAGPVALRLTRILGPRQSLWDADSVGRGSAKELIDSLVACGWLHDDGPKWVTSVEYRQEVDRANGPAVRVEFLQLEAPE